MTCKPHILGHCALWVTYSDLNEAMKGGGKIQIVRDLCIIWGICYKLWDICYKLWGICYYKLWGICYKLWDICASFEEEGVVPTNHPRVHADATLDYPWRYRFGDKVLWQRWWWWSYKSIKHLKGCSSINETIKHLKGWKLIFSTYES